VIGEGAVRAHLARTVAGLDLSVASRTDRGVSARGNALVLQSSLPGPALLRALNGISSEIFFTRARRVPEGFTPRAATERWYRYFERDPGADVDRWRRSAALFTGRLDVRSLGRGLPGDQPTWRDVTSLTVRRSGRGITLDIRAPSFVWGMVRKIVAGLRALDRGEVSAEEVRSALSGGRRLALPMAEPEPLILWNVAYPGRWEHAWTGPNRRQAEFAEETRHRLSAEIAILKVWGHRPV
jgi:tRNA pseudouridine38-40 synthase